MCGDLTFPLHKKISNCSLYKSRTCRQLSTGYYSPAAAAAAAGSRRWSKTKDLFFSPDFSRFAYNRGLGRAGAFMHERDRHDVAYCQVGTVPTNLNNIYLKK